MKCNIEVLKVEKLINEISCGKLDIQPDFHRGDVWNKAKKQKLIDTIIRGWIIPPIQVIEDANFSNLIILDGQQRLQTIYSFIRNEFCVDGTIEPHDDSIYRSHGLYFSELNDEVQRSILQYSISVVVLTEYSPQDAGELFNRLNQSTNLTSAEKRNTYFGQTRDQIKQLTRIFDMYGISSEKIGFSNSRMAYEDVLSKYCFTIEIDTLRYRITNSDLSDRYRYDKEFSGRTIRLAEKTIEKLSYLLNYNNITNMNKASLFSWLIFLTYRDDDFKETFSSLEKNRNLIRHYEFYNDGRFMNSKYEFTEELIYRYYRCCSMGASETRSIITRDACLYLYDCMIRKKHTKKFVYFLNAFKDTQSFEYALERLVDRFQWGGHIYEEQKND